MYTYATAHTNKEHPQVSVIRMIRCCQILSFKNQHVALIYKLHCTDAASKRWRKRKKSKKWKYSRPWLRPGIVARATHDPWKSSTLYGTPITAPDPLDSSSRPSTWPQSRWLLLLLGISQTLSGTHTSLWPCRGSWNRSWWWTIHLKVAHLSHLRHLARSVKRVRTAWGACSVGSLPREIMQKSHPKMMGPTLQIHHDAHDVDFYDVFIWTIDWVSGIVDGGMMMQESF